MIKREQSKYTCFAEREVKLLGSITVLPGAVACGTIDNPCLLLIQFKVALFKACCQLCFQLFRLFPCTAVSDGVIRIAFEGYVGMVYLHPLVEHIVQEEVSQNGAYD